MIIRKNPHQIFCLSFSEVSREEASSALVDLILEYKLFVMVAYLGPNLVKVVNFMERYVRRRKHPLWERNQWNN